LALTTRASVYVRIGGVSCLILSSPSNSNAPASLAQIQALGDFRSGSITAIQGRCGKANRRCHQPGPCPNYRLTRKGNGKTVSESFTSATGSVRRSVRWRRFIASGNSVRNCWRRMKTHSRRRGKTAEAIQQEIVREVAQQLRVLFTGHRKTGQLDLEAVEMAVRSAMHQGRSRRAHPPAPFRLSAAGASTPRFSVRPPGSLSRSADQTDSHRAGLHRAHLSLLSVPALPHRPVSRRCRAGQRQHRLLARCAPHERVGGPSGSFRARAPANAVTRRFGISG